jgi:hypothetical protein
MAEFVKFLPEVRSGELWVLRQLFYVPLLSGAVGLVLVAANRHLLVPRSVRRLVTIASVPVALSMLPPAWTPQLLLTAEFRLQTAAILLCLVVAALCPVLRRVHARVLEAVTAALALAAAVAPLWQFLRVRPAIDAVYGRRVRLGWGPWVTTMGFGLVVVLALLAVSDDRTPVERNHETGIVRTHLE